jgi:hypothetical protein
MHLRRMLRIQPLGILGNIITFEQHRADKTVLDKYLSVS